MIIKTFRGNRYEPAEYEYTNPDSCLKCGLEHDLDEGDFKRVEDIGILCPECYLVCTICGDDVTEDGCLPESVINRNGEYTHAVCEAAEILEMPILSGTI
jgi:hypothetical protein